MTSPSEPDRPSEPGHPPKLGGPLERGREFHREVSRKEARKLRARRGDVREIWYGFGMFGMVGWSVAVPTLIGLTVGIWLDRRIDRPYSFTLMGLLLGVCLGCYLAWYWVTRESTAGEREGRSGDDGVD